MKACFKYILSIPIHEKPEVVIDQLCNIKHYWRDNYAVILHISKGFNWDSWYMTANDFKNIIALFDNVFINPESLDTKWGGIIHTHLSNFKYAESIIEFDYFVIVASNELFIKSGISRWIEGKDYGCQTSRLLSNIGDKWAFSKNVLADNNLKQMCLKENINDIYCSAPEGTFYKRELFHDMNKIINKYYTFDMNEDMYPREEVYLPTLAICLNGTENIRHRHYSSMGLNITTAQEVYEKSEELYSIKPVRRELYDEMRVWIRSYYNGGYFEIVKEYMSFIAEVKLSNIV